MCDIYRKKKEILQAKSTKNVSFAEARRIVGEYMKPQIYTTIVKKTKNKMNEANHTEAKQESRYIELIERFLKLSSDEWPSFHKHLRNIYNESWEGPGNKSRK